MMTRPPPRSFLSLAYLVVGLGLVGAWGYAAAAGIERAGASVKRLPPDVRTSPGGYRSFHFWHAGYRGGK